MNQANSPTIEEESQPITGALEFIKLLAIAVAPTHCRLIVAGSGPYSDLVLQLFGQTSAAVEILNKLRDKLLVSYPNLTLVDEGLDESAHLFSFYDGQEIKAHLTYFQTLESPFEEVFDTFIANLEGVIFEATQSSRQSYPISASIS